MDDFLSIAVEDGGKIQGIRVLTIIDMWSVVHQSLLQSNLIAEPLIEANCPR